MSRRSVVSALVEAGLEPQIVRPGFHQSVYQVVARVPAGAVTTYGDVATLLGSPRVARHVGWALAALFDGPTEVPWHRVVNASGAISHRGDLVRAALQQSLLEKEGVRFDAAGKIVDFRAVRYRYPERAE